MSAIKNSETNVTTVGRDAHVSSQTDVGTDPMAWWEQWAVDHKEQIEAYNKDVAQNGLWSDGLRAF
jgi:hypothetical protein